MLQELTHMDRITQLQDEIQQLLLIMSKSLTHLTTRADFMQISPLIPVTKHRNPEKVDAPDVFEENKKELVRDLVAKAKQIEYLIQSLPVPEPEEDQAKRLQTLEAEMTEVNAEYIKALDRTKRLHIQVSELLRNMLKESDDTGISAGMGTL
ncbi:hypothetical protein CYLTODRAFT_417722 [Cylindrobasidium torrendii FP15055 ss-10]|uniref:Mediator of RNA polymerase II transcription subunit 21 n=1 Tax=Cylindrobasidium torrendii FP15055 ss-10 TaxID=1314674 RepID=A0A0D7BRE9_9AGAR|nr:hypothetical protein CYLTODRAFT_417722 [Cylindrobasidium torrendii FP15055 ss-10]